MMRSSPGGRLMHSCITSARTTAPASTALPTTAMPADVGTTIGALSRRAARARSSADSASSPPPVTRTALASAPASDDDARRRVRPWAARSRRRVRRRPRHPDAAPSGVRARAACRSAISTGCSGARERRPAASARLRPRRASARAVEHRRTGDERAERGEPEREHRAGHQPQRDGSEHRNDRGEQRHRRSCGGTPRRGQLERLGGGGRRSRRTRAGSRRGGEEGGHPHSQAPRLARRSTAPRGRWTVARSVRLGRSRRPERCRVRHPPPRAPTRRAR